MEIEKNHFKKGIWIIILSAIEIFLSSGYCKNIQFVYIGALIHLLLLLTISIIIAERNTHRVLYYVEFFANYLLVFPMYNNWHSGIDEYLIFLYQIPLLLNYYISQNQKQLVILNINSIVVIGFIQRGLLLFSGTLNEVETEGVVTFFTMCAMIIAIVISIVLLLVKRKRT